MIGERLRALRKEKKMTMKEFGQKFGLAESTISGYENNTRAPDYELLQKFADFFDVSTDYLLGRTEKESTASSLSSDEQEFLDWVSQVDDAFFYDFHKSPEEQKRQWLETMRALWEIEKKRGNK